MAEVGTGLFLGDTPITTIQNNNFVFANPIDVSDAGTWQFRTDANASDLVFATPGNQVSDISMTYAWSDVQADIKGSGTNKTVLTSDLSTSTATKFATDGYTESTEVTGNGAFLKANDSTFTFSNLDWTFETWVNAGTLTAANIDRAIYSDYKAGSLANSSLWLRLNDAKLQMILDSTVEVYISSAAQTFVANQWHHIAFTRNGNEINAYFDGTRVLNQAYSATLNTTTQGKYLMGYYNAAEATIGVQDYRIYKGFAKYTGTSFTPPPSMGEYV